MATPSYAELLAIAATGPVGQEFQEGFVERSEIEDQLLQAQIDAIKGNINEFVILADEKSPGTGGGDFVAGARRVRDLNAIYKFPSTLTWCTLAANQWTISANGRYLLIAVAPAVEAEHHRAAVYNVTDAGDEPGLFGKGYAFTGVNADNQAIILGGFDLTAAPKKYQLEHECTITKLATGFGVSANLGTERFAQVIIARLNL